VNALLIMFPIIGAGALAWVFGAVFGPKSVRLNVGERVGLGATWFLGVVAVTICLQMIWGMLRHPLGDASPSPLYPLPSKLRGEEITAHTPTEEGDTSSSVNERVESQ
jgi:hypothetical protein